MELISPARFLRKNLLVAVFWLLCTSTLLYACVDSARDFILGQRSNHYVATPGKMIRSALTERSGEDGTPSYNVEVKYEYVVQGKRYEGHEFRYGPLNNGRRAAIEHYVHEFGPGAPVVVFHDPIAPDRAVLRRGVSRQLYFAPAFLFPFVLASLLLAASGIRRFHLQCRGQPEGGLPTAVRGKVTVVRLDAGEALILAGGFAAAGSVVTLIPFAIAGAHKVPGLALSLFGIELAAFGISFARLSRRAGRLLIDTNAQRLTLRRSGVEQSWSFAELRGLWVRPESGPIAAQKSSPAQAVAVGLDGPEGLHDVVLHSWSARDRAELFRGWLARHLPDNLPSEAPTALLAQHRAYADGLPRTWLRPPSWITIGVGLALAIPFAFVSLVFLAIMALGRLELSHALLLPFAVFGPFLLAHTLKSLRMRLCGDARAFVVDPEAFYWGELRRGESLEVLRAMALHEQKVSHEKGYIKRGDLREIQYACGSDEDEVYAHLATGLRVKLPQDVLWGDAMYELAALVREHFPEVVVVNKGARAST